MLKGYRAFGFGLLVALMAMGPGVLAEAPQDYGLPRTEPVPDVTGFIEGHPAIADAMICQFPRVTLSYKDWTPAEKEYLRSAFKRAWHGEPSGLPDPLPNAFQLKNDEPVRQGLSEQDALQFYFATIAASLAFELEQTYNWSITSYAPEELAVLFDSRQMFQLVPRPPSSKGPAVYEIQSEISGVGLPAPPEVGQALMRRHSLVSVTPIGTISKLLTWCAGLSHFTGDNKTANVRAQWHYDGYPPESRVISGTIFDDGKGKPSSVIHHFTFGCHGTASFLRAVLRNVNIPVEIVHLAGHSLPYFPTLGACMTHGDDPYNQLVRTMQPPLIMNRLFITPERFEQLFGAKVDPKLAKSHVSSQTRVLAVANLPTHLLVKYLDDQKGGKGHADGMVAKDLSADFTVAQLEEKTLWARMDARIGGLGGPEKVRALDTKTLEETTNHTPE